MLGKSFLGDDVLGPRLRRRAQRCGRSHDSEARVAKKSASRGGGPPLGAGFSVRARSAASPASADPGPMRRDGGGRARPAILTPLLTGIVGDPLMPGAKVRESDTNDRNRSAGRRPRPARGRRERGRPRRGRPGADGGSRARRAPASAHRSGNRPWRGPPWRRGRGDGAMVGRISPPSIPRSAGGPETPTTAPPLDHEPRKRRRGGVKVRRPGRWGRERRASPAPRRSESGRGPDRRSTAQGHRTARTTSGSGGRFGSPSAPDRGGPAGRGAGMPGGRDATAETWRGSEGRRTASSCDSTPNGRRPTRPP
jgi:hypothetical protein